ncbi:MAG: hypothetical protein P4L41_18125 [Flavipsychrobacter sp.]|nr:hypothetical protein [Flavipsychrobacter sp.]
MLKKSLLSLLVMLCLVQEVQAQLSNLEQSAVECWHATLARQLHVPDSQFLLYQGTATLGSSSIWLWNIFNAVIMDEDDIYYNPVQLNSLSGNYNWLIYDALATDTLTPSCDLEKAIENFQDAKGTFAWNKTLDDLQAGLSSSPPMQFMIDTTFIENGNNSKAPPIMMHMIVQASFTHVLKFVSYPYSPSDAPAWQLQQYSPWYMQCILKKAYYNVDNSFLSPIDWNSIFGPDGSLHEICYALVVVDGENIKVTASDNNNTYSTTITSPQPIILGVLVATVPDYILQNK